MRRTPILPPAGRPGCPVFGGDRRRGSILLMVMVLLMMLSLLAVTVIYRRQTDEQAVFAAEDKAAARRLADSGINAAMAWAMEDRYQSALAFGSFATDAAHTGLAEPDLFREQKLPEGLWSLVRIDTDPEFAGGEVRYGFDDEAGRLNINTASREQWQSLLSEFGVENVDDVLAAIEQWRGAPLDRAAGGGGGGSGGGGSGGSSGAAAAALAGGGDPLSALTAQQQPPAGGYNSERAAAPFRNKGAFFETVEELLRVTLPDGSPAFPRSLMYGSDRNRNGRIDPGEDGASIAGVPPGGLYPYLTVWSVDYSAAKADGTKLININRSLTPDPNAAAGTGAMAENPEQQFLREMQEAGIDQAMAEAIIGFRRSGQLFFSVGDLAGIPNVSPEVLAQTFELVVTQDVNPGAINVNTASLPVMTALLMRVPRFARDPQTAAATAQQLTALRPTLGDRGRNLAWLLDVLTVDDLRFVARYATTRSFQFRADSVGYTTDGRTFARVEAVFDTALSRPRILYYRDISALGPPERPSTE